MAAQAESKLEERIEEMLRVWLRRAAPSGPGRGSLLSDGPRKDLPRTA